jgi:ribonuclease E
MATTDVPAGDARGQSGASGAPRAATLLQQLPDRLRVHALARLLGSSSKVVLAALERLGAPARGAQSGIDRDTAARVVTALLPEPAGDDPVGGIEVAEGDRPPAADPEPEAAGSEAPDTRAGLVQFSGGLPPVVPLVPLFAAPQPAFTAPGTSPIAEPAAPADGPAEEPAPAAGEGRSRRTRSRRRGGADPEATPAAEVTPADPVAADDEAEQADAEASADDDEDGAARRRRRRGRRGRGRGRGADGDVDGDGDGDDLATDGPADQPGAAENKDDADDAETDDDEADSADADPAGGQDGEETESGRKRRRRRRRRGGSGEESDRPDDPPNTVVHVRDRSASRSGDSRPGDSRDSRSGDARSGDARSGDARSGDPRSGDEVQSVRGSTRLEAKRQRRRDGREAGRRRPAILSEAEFLARREAVERVMVVREQTGTVQIGVLEDEVLVEHFVTRSGNGSLVGNVYLGRVQNVLPSMEAAFVDIGRGRNAVLYAGEVDWDAAGLEGKARRIEQALSPGDSVLVQVTKDPVGHKGARLTTQISLPGRFLVYVPGGGATGISRKLPDIERKRLKDILKRIVPDDAGVIIRTASEGTGEEALDRDVRRLQAQWEVIKSRGEAPGAKAPQLLYEEPDLLIKVVRDLFTEDFAKLVVQGGDAWNTIEDYVAHVAPELADRLSRHVPGTDVFAAYRIDEQILKALDRKVWLPSGGYLVIDRTEAMTVVDVNTGKYTGSGGNLEETVTRNNLEAAEEVVRQLRLRDIGGIIVIDFIDMVLENNRDLVLRRLTECLGRDRTRHQVAEVTSLGLVQMTRKRVGTGLLEAYSTPCEHCRGRGAMVSASLLDGGQRADSGPAASQSNGSGSGGNGNGTGSGSGTPGQSAGSGSSRRRRHRGSDNAAEQSAAQESAAGEVDAGAVEPAGQVTTTPPAAHRGGSRNGAGPVADVADLAVPVAEPAAPGSAAPGSQKARSEPADSGAVIAVGPDAARTDPGPVDAGVAPDGPAEHEPADSNGTTAHLTTVGTAALAAPRKRRRRAASRPAGPPDAGELTAHSSSGAVGP